MLPLNDRILLVDDNTDNLLILEELLALEYTVMSATTGDIALRLAPCFRPDLVLLDVMMPGLDGIDTCQRLRALPELNGSRIVMVSAKNELQDRLKAYDVGAVDYVEKPFNNHEVSAKVHAWMQMVQRDRVNEIWREAEMARQAVGSAMLNLASFRDTETGDHLFRVRLYAQLLAEALATASDYHQDVTTQFRESLYCASPLHDIGKVAISDAILRKPGPLTKEEYKVMQRHTVIGGELLRAAARKLPNAKYLQMAADIARHHHERFDGSGYPDRLANAAIPLAARILAVADVFDALTAKRVYREPVNVSEAARIIAQESGRQFDPVVVESFRLRLDEFRQARTRFAQNCAMYDSSLLPATAFVADRYESGSYVAGLST